MNDQTPLWLLALCILGGLVALILTIWVAAHIGQLP